MDVHRPDPAPGRLRRRAGTQAWTLNVAVSALLGALYLRHAPPEASFATWMTLGLGVLANAALWSVVPGLLGQLGARLLRPDWLFATWSAGIWTVAQTALFVDTVIYGIFRYHFNAMVWNVLTTAGAGDSVHVGPGEWSLVALGAVVYWVLVHAFVRRRLERLRGEDEAPPLPLRPGVVWGILIGPAVFVAMGLYAYADFAQNRSVTALARLFPLYPQLTVKRLLRDSFGMQPSERPSVDLSTSGVLLEYPRQRPPIDPEGPRPNILLIVVDSLRADMLDAEVMPELSRFAQGARVFRDHLSGGNATRFGIFSLIYGLHGSYWNAIYAERRSPVLIDELLDLGYDTRVLSRVSMSYPELRATAWVRLPEGVEDDLTSSRPGGWDDRVVTRFEEWIADRGESAAPFFAFALIDAPHQDYHFPEPEAVFRPFADEVDYLRIAGGASDDESRALFNRYRNAVHYADGRVGRLLATLDEHGLADDTIVIVTGDHGEEFFENGFHGHTSNFTVEQVRVPFVMAGPGIPVGEETGPTCHSDVPATLLELLGADPSARADWTLGGNLLEPDPGRERIVSGWNLLCIWGPERMVVVPTATHRGGIDVYDQDWHIPKDEASTLRSIGAPLGRLAFECGRFVR